MLWLVIVGVRWPIFCILLKDDILKCMYIDMAGAFVTTYLFLWNKNFKAQQTLLYNDYLNSLNLCKISEDTKHDI